MQRHQLYTLILIVAILPLSAFSQLAVPKFFSDGMVLQQKKEIKVWGIGHPDSKVQLSFANQSTEVKADAEGHWMATFPPMNATTNPQTLSISDGKIQIEIKDIVVGEVWLCSGQSNMDWSICSFNYAQEEKDNANFPHLRMFRVDKDLAHENKADIPGGEWKSAEGNNVLHFSATAYFFGKYIHQELNVPIGLITASWGGTNVEAWMPPESWNDFLDIKEVFASQNNELQTMDLAARQKVFEALLTKNVVTGIGISENWQNPNTNLADWEPITIPQEKGNDLFDAMDGAIWFRKTFEIPLPFRGKDLIANLGQMNDHDMVWVNGHKIGESRSRSDWRNYLINKEYLNSGLNEIVVRVFDYQGDGGYVTDPYFINIHPAGDKKGYYLLSGDWKYKIGKKLSQPLELPNIPSNKGRLANITPSSLYHQMIHPFRHLAISGAIWYQGESNSSRGYEYQYLFPAMIKGWRAAFQQSEFPFLFVQLPNFHGKSRDGQLSNWPELRAGQAAALQLPQTGMAVTLDIGEENNIHPQNKKDVGKRLALAALNMHYQKGIPYKGPEMEEMRIEEHTAILTFNHSGEGLQSGKQEEDYGLPIYNFEVAGEDGVFYKAQARIVGKNEIKVWSKEVKTPVYVRYAWKNNPANANLFNSHGLPAPPFQTGKWEWDTQGNKYIQTIK